MRIPGAYLGMPDNMMPKLREGPKDKIVHKKFEEGASRCISLADSSSC